MIMVTHNSNIAETADRIIKMNSGKIVSVIMKAQNASVPFWTATALRHISDLLSVLFISTGC